MLADFLVVVLTPPLRLPATGAAAPLVRKLQVNYGLGISGAWILVDPERILIHALWGRVPSPQGGSGLGYKLKLR